MAAIPAEYQPELERILQKRLAEQADAIKLAGVDKAINRISREMATLRRETNRRLDAANHLKEEMVTKDEFTTAMKSLKDGLAGVVTVEDLGGGEIWVRAGVPHGLSAREIEAVRTVADQALAAQVRQRFHETWWGRLGIIAGLVLAAVEVWRLFHP